VNPPPIARAALILALGNLGSRILGLGREQVIAGLFGATAATDAFRVAFRVPMALYDLLVGGMISSALVPVFSGYLARGERRELARMVSTLLNLLVLALMAIVLFLIASAPLLVRFIAAGYPDDVQLLSADLLRMILPALVFMGVSAVLTAALYAQQRFGFPALSVMAFNIGIVAAAVTLHGQMGITSLAVGVLVGAGLQVLLQLPGMRDQGFQLLVDLTHPGVRESARLYLPVALGLVVSTVGIAIDTNLASHTGAGNLAAMGFATTLVQFPLGMVAAAVSSAVLPSLSRHARAFTHEDTTQAAAPVSLDEDSETPNASPEESVRAFRETLALGLKLVLLTIIPATLALLALREQVVRLLFQRGAFDALATQRTSTAFLAYSPGLPAAAIDQVLIFGYYARGKTLPPVLVGVMSVGVYVVLAVALLGPLGMPGLALANSAQWVSHMVAMLALTHRSTGGLGGLGLPATLGRASLSSGVMIALVLCGLTFSVTDVNTGTLKLAASLAGLMGMGAAAYFGTLAVIGRSDLRLLASALFRRFAKEE